MGHNRGGVSSGPGILIVVGQARRNAVGQIGFDGDIAVHGGCFVQGRGSTEG